MSRIERRKIADELTAKLEGNPQFFHLVSYGPLGVRHSAIATTCDPIDGLFAVSEKFASFGFKVTQSEGPAGLAEILISDNDFRLYCRNVMPELDLSALASEPAAMHEIDLSAPTPEPAVTAPAIHLRVFDTLVLAFQQTIESQPRREHIAPELTTFFEGSPTFTRVEAVTRMPQDSGAVGGVGGHGQSYEEDICVVIEVRFAAKRSADEFLMRCNEFGITSIEREFDGTLLKMNQAQFDKLYGSVRPSLDLRVQADRLPSMGDSHGQTMFAARRDPHAGSVDDVGVGLDLNELSTNFAAASDSQVTVKNEDGGFNVFFESDGLRQEFLQRFLPSAVEKSDFYFPKESVVRLDMEQLDEVESQLHTFGYGLGN